MDVNINKMETANIFGPINDKVFFRFAGKREDLRIGTEII